MNFKKEKQEEARNSEQSNVSYVIKYDIDRDIWNWYYGVNYSDLGDQLTDNKDLSIIAKITGLGDIKQAEPILRPFLEKKINDAYSDLNKFISIANAEFADKFDEACRLIVEMTNRPLAKDKFTFYITTFPRMTVFFDEGVIFMYAKIDNILWGMPVDGFLHEIQHFQLDKYWRSDDQSMVSKLSDDEYFMLKESLTVVLDDELKPIITVPDSSYREFADFRQVIHENWKTHHNFDELVQFSLQKLPKYYK